MAKQLVAKLRKSASVILIVKNGVPSEKKANYKVLLFNRNEKATFMPNQAVFPGGVSELNDESTKWQQYFQNCFQTNSKSNETRNTRSIQEVPSDLDLRITAVRETFEEVGVMLAKECNTVNLTNLAINCSYGTVKENFDRHFWQKCVHNDSTKFLTLCQELNILPDVHNLHTWSNWLTPSTFPKRFDTTFYVVLLAELPQVISEETEVKNFEWKTPHEFLNDYYNKKIWLPPPQVYELARLLNFNDIDQLKEFLQNRQERASKSNALTALLPVQCKCTNGVVSLLPGDELYPAEPNKSTEMISTSKSIEEFSKNIKRLHRLEFFSSYDCVIRVNMESTALDHVLPINYHPVRK